MISSREMSMANLIFPYQTPTTKEGFYYRKIFDELFPHMEHLTSKWIPRTDWDGVKSSDPSGRVYDIHENKKTETTSQSRNRLDGVSDLSCLI